MDEYFGKNSILCGIAPWLPDGCNAFWKRSTNEQKVENKYNFNYVVTRNNISDECDIESPFI